MRIVERLSHSGHEADAQAVLKVVAVFHTEEDRLVGYVDEVKSGQVSRAVTK